MSMAYSIESLKSPKYSKYSLLNQEQRDRSIEDDQGGFLISQPSNN